MAGGCVVWSSVMVVLALCRGCVAVKPGFRTALTSKGLDYICQVVIPILEKELSSLAIPDISGSADSPIGRIDYTLKDIQLSNLVMGTSSLTSSSTGLQVTGGSVSAYAEAHWQYREHSWPHIEGHGTCGVYISETDFQVDIVVGANSKGQATLSSTYCHFYIKKMDIVFHGGDSWLYNLFSSYISDDFKSAVESQICTVAVSEIDTQGNAALESIPVIVPIDSTSEVDFALLQSPTFTSSYVETQHKGEFLDIAHPVEAPFTPPSLPPVSTNSSNMLFMWLTDYIADTAGFVYLTAGLLTYNVTPDMIPPSIPFQLNTSSFRALIPQLYSKYPNWAMLLQLNATKPPLLTLSPSGGNLTAFGDVLVYVINPANQTDIQLAFVLGTIILADAKIYLQSSSTQEMVCANTTFLKVDLSLAASNIGTFSANVLQEAANVLCTAFIIPAINQRTNVGIPLPTVAGLALVNPSLTFKEDCVLVNTDFSYTSSSGRSPAHRVGII